MVSAELHIALSPPAAVPSSRSSPGPDSVSEGRFPWGQSTQRSLRTSLSGHKATVSCNLHPGVRIFCS